MSYEIKVPARVSGGHNIIVKGKTPGMTVRMETATGEVEWMTVPVTLPQGYRIVATVDRDDGSIWDLGQNNDKEFRLFQRYTDPWRWHSHGPATKLSPQDIQGFGLTDDPQFCQADVEGEGQYSAIYTSNFIP
jgi:hypothetical protein